MGDEFAVVATPEPEGDGAPQVAPPGPLIGLHLSNALSDAVALRFGEGGSDRQKEFGYAVAGDVAAEIEQMEPDAPLEGRAE